MVRKPVDIQSQYLRGQDFYWRTIRELAAGAGAFTITEIADRSNGERNSVAEYMRRLETAGFICRAGRRATGAVEYRIARDSRTAPRVRRDGSRVGQTKQDHMWRAMKMLRRFTVTDLAVAASTESVAVSMVHADDYIKHLCRAGYVRCVSQRPRCYVMVRSKNTGPRAPYIQRVKQVFDPNLNKVVWRAGDDDDN